MENLKLEKSTAIELFRDKKTPDGLKKILIDTFGKECFSEKITDRIKTFEDAYNEADEQTRKQYDCEWHIGLNEDTISYLQRKLIVKVLRGDWEPDWNDSNQRKWYPWFKWSAGSGFVFSHSTYSYDITLTSVGSRLCFPTEELADYFGRQFIEIHNQFLTINK